MTELREFAQRSSEFEKLGVRIIGISVDDQDHAREAWEKAGNKKFTILSNPSAKVIRRYGLLHEKGHGESDIALRTTLLVDPEGRERWRRVSQSVPDIPKADETLADIKKAQDQKSGLDKDPRRDCHDANTVEAKRNAPRGEEVLRKSEIAAVVPALGASLLPSLSCPACWPAYASVLSAVGLSFLVENKYLLWLNLFALMVSLMVLARRHASYVPLLIEAPAAMLIISGKFLWNSNPVTWLGAAALLAAFVWRRPRAKSAGCPACLSNTSLEEVEHVINES